MQFKLSINCDNDAFDADAAAEVARILRETAEWVDSLSGKNPIAHAIADSNGNRVGQWAFTE